MNIFSNAEQVSALTEGLNQALEVTQRYADLTSGTVDGSTTEQQLLPKRSGEAQRTAWDGED
jgi:hypothetical protein